MAYCNRSTRPPRVLSAERYEATRWKESCDERKLEDERYEQYLKDGGAALCKRFPRKRDPDKEARLRLEEARQRNIDFQEEALHNLKLERKERILKANAILESLKPNAKVKLHALGHEPKHHDTIREKIEKDKEKLRLAKQQCPERLIPFSLGAEEQLAAERKAKAKLARADFLRDSEEKRMRKMAAENLERFESMVERDEMEKQALKEQVAKKRQFCHQANRDALKEKASIRKHECMCDQIEDRIRCVNVLLNQCLDSRQKQSERDWYERNNHAKEVMTKQLEEDKKERAAKLQRWEAKIDWDEARQLHHRQELAKQRRASELEDRKRAEERRQREAEIKRFKIAERLKSSEVKKLFEASVKQQKRQQAGEAAPPIQNHGRLRDCSRDASGYYTPAELCKRCRLEQAKDRQRIAAKNSRINEVISEMRPAKRYPNRCDCNCNLPARTPSCGTNHGKTIDPPIVRHGERRVRWAEPLVEVLYYVVESKETPGKLPFTTKVIPQATREAPCNRFDKSSLTKCPERHRLCVHGKQEPSKGCSLWR